MKKIIILLSIFLLKSTKYNKEYFDIKGNVKNPGVYEIKENYTIEDAIKIAGGLKKNSYTDNINLSKKVKDEMVIYIFKKEEIDSINLNECICETKYVYIECEEEENNKDTSIISPIEPTIEEPTIEEPTNITTTTTAKPISKININKCTKEELLTLEGLGDKKAEAIINYRIENGEFLLIEDIMKVKGIGETTFEKVKNFIEI